MGFAAGARTAAGGTVSLGGKQKVIWRKQAAADPADPNAAPTWVIESWLQKDLHGYSRAATLYSEVLDQLLPNADTLTRARQSLHEQIILKTVQQPGYQAPAGFALHAVDQHPGLSVVDIDADGWDDLYVMARWGKNMLLHNRGDGTFEDVAADYGLDIADFCTSAVFADLDNDGDKDLVLGRSMQRSMYLVNEDGRYVERSKELLAVQLPFLVSSVAVVDFNADGLLDIYFSTYAAGLWQQEFIAYLSSGVEQRRRAGETVDTSAHKFLARFLRPNQARTLFEKTPTGHVFLDRPGPPNVLLVNKGGGRFEPSRQRKLLGAWRNTYQSTWGDYDGDGHVDVYLANDFAPNNLFRNKGDGTFEEVTAATGTADIGFGMGAAWGDYDNDGQQDLYVTNMFSKAGRRITSQLADLNPEFQQMARGNSLFQNKGGAFEKVSGLAGDTLLVEQAGWSWGGQFLDFNNDGFLDVYALSGNYTAPAEIAVPVDT
jgi:hypothetical protein